MAIRGHHVHESNELANGIDKIVDRNYNDINDSLKVTVTNGGGLDTVFGKKLKSPFPRVGLFKARLRLL